MNAECITFTNHTGKPIQVISTKDNLASQANHIRSYTIPPKESFVIFVEGVESLHWEKIKES